MGFFDIFKLLKKENRLYLFLVWWLIIGFAALQFSAYYGVPIIGIIIYLPFLSFTLYLYFNSLKRKDLREQSFGKLLRKLIISLFLMPILILAVIALPVNKAPNAK